MSTITRSNSTVTKEKVKQLDIVSFLGFSPETLPHPENVPINRFAFELFFENSLKPQIGRFALTSDHIEHGFQIFAEKTEEKPKLKEIITHLFLFAFTEILFADGSARSNLFLERQGSKSLLSDEELRQLVDLDPEMTDSIHTIFDHLVAPLDLQLDPDFFIEVNKIFDSAPAISFLLRHFLHDETTTISPPSLLTTPTHRETIDRTIQDDVFPQFFTEAPAPNIQQPSIPYAKFRYVKNYPTIYINQPKYIPPPLPSLTCIHIPKYAQFCSASRTKAAAVFTVDTQIYYIAQNSSVKELIPHPRNITCIQISKCGEWVLSGDAGGNILFQNIDKTRHFFYQSANSLITCLSIAPAMPHQFAVGLIDGSALLYDTAKKQPIRMFVGHSAPIVGIEIHPSSEYVATTSLDGMVRVWWVTYGCCVRLIRGVGATPSLIRISHNGQWILAASTQGDVILADLGNGKPFKTIKLSAGITCADFSPNDDVVAAVDSAGNFLVWETKEIQNELPSSIRVDKTRVMALEYLDQSEVRLVGCQK